MISQVEAHCGSEMGKLFIKFWASRDLRTFRELLSIKSATENHSYPMQGNLFLI
jgi:hypothetical protein